MKVRELLAEAVRRIGGGEARLEAELLLAHALGKPRSWLYAWPDAEPEAGQTATYGTLVSARARGESVAYLLGRREFHSIDLRVTPDVLIPRPETELLVELALAAMPRAAAVDVADLGTGSGAIALAIAHSRPNARVTATDASESALAIARANAERLGIANVAFACGDWFAALGERRFDVIVSNPPYIAEGDPHLERGDLRFEPRAALASGLDGLDAIRAIVSGAPRHLRAVGRIFIEHGADQAAAVRVELASHGFVDIESHRDLEHRDRVSSARRP